MDCYLLHLSNFFSAVNKAGLERLTALAAPYGDRLAISGIAMTLGGCYDPQISEMLDGHLIFASADGHQTIRAFMSDMEGAFPNLRIKSFPLRPVILEDAEAGDATGGHGFLEKPQIFLSS